jgi:Na+-translocating ferredoxin:NAD+ oxidoreductase RnfD subunit
MQAGRMLDAANQSARRFLRTPKGSLLAIFLTLFVTGATAIGWPLALPHLLAGVLGASVTDLLIDRFDRRTRGWPSSALLSGMIVGFVLSPVTPWAVTAAVGLLATLSKRLFATRRWHVFNPAGLALLLSIPLFGTSQSWWGALPDLSWPFVLLLLAAGVFIVDRIDKFPLVLSFLGASFGLLSIFGRIDSTTVAELFRAPFLQATLFLGLFMLTDPPTSPSRYKDQLSVGLLVGASGVAAQLLGAGQAYLLIGLLVGNVVFAIRRWLNQRPRSATEAYASSPRRHSLSARALN